MSLNPRLQLRLWLQLTEQELLVVRPEEGEGEHLAQWPAEETHEEGDTKEVEVKPHLDNSLQQRGEAEVVQLVFLLQQQPLLEAEVSQLALLLQQQPLLEAEVVQLAFLLQQQPLLEA